MQPNKAYDEVIEFIASSSPQNVIAFRPSEEAKARVADLIFREKTEGLSEDEKSELDHYLQIEHLMRLARVRAYDYLIRGVKGQRTAVATDFADLLGDGGPSDETADEMIRTVREWRDVPSK